MTPEKWNAILLKSNSLRPIRRIEEARGAVRLHLHLAAECEQGPVGIVTDPRYLWDDTSQL